jgi:Asp-tRNA(Asn)/Glu-tRNA(Gln) amidotransferase A subunit family amidase
MLGHYTHFGNLLDLLGIAIPLGVAADGRPFSAMLLGAALSDDTVLHLAAQILDEPRTVRRPATTPAPRSIPKTSKELA